MAEKKEKQYVSDNAQLMAEWNWEKNNELGLDPNKLTCGSGKKAWWKCSKGHEWLARISHRHSGVGCPYCSGRNVIRGQNDLQTVNPTVATEWNFEKNTGLSPRDVLPNSDKKVWWKCSNGHEWQATIANRNRGGHGCPICNSERHTSFYEYALEYYLEKLGFCVIHPYKSEGYELDIFIPSLKIGIEYDGGYWHKNKVEKDLEKNKSCFRDKIRLYRIRENLQALNDTSTDYVVHGNQKDIVRVLKEILDEITKCNVDVDVKRDALEIDNLRTYTYKKNSLLVCNPQLANEWNHEKNKNLKPENFSPSSGKKLWWRCKEGHEWQATIASRNKGNGCPYCSGRNTIKGYNDLQTKNSAIVIEWNYEKNTKLTPIDVMLNSGMKVWWKCNKGHEWRATVASRNRGNGCPFCSGRKILRGFNDLQTVNQSLANEWNFSKNGGLTPEDVLPNSDKKVWWKCSLGHEWESTVAHRNNGRKCPYCSSNKTLKGFNDLLTANPLLATEWNYTKNGTDKPEDYMPNSNKKVWWKCSKGHEWEATIQSRNKGSGCPYCSGRYAIKGENDLQTVNPTLAKEWNYEKNNGLTPVNILPNSHKKVWWKCQKCHEWEATVNHRNKGRGCPECAKEKRKKKSSSDDTEKA